MPDTDQSLGHSSGRELVRSGSDIKRNCRRVKLSFRQPKGCEQKFMDRLGGYSVAFNSCAKLDSSIVKISHCFFMAAEDVIFRDSDTILDTRRIFEQLSDKSRSVA